MAEKTGSNVEPALSGRQSMYPSKETRHPIRILVVDGDPQTLRYVRDALAASGYEPLVAEGHENLSQVIRTEQPQLVLLDLMLHRTDAIKLMESVPEFADLPVIFISGYGRDETIAQALESRVADYIVKPFLRHGATRPRVGCTAPARRAGAIRVGRFDHTIRTAASDGGGT